MRVVLLLAVLWFAAALAPSGPLGEFAFPAAQADDDGDDGDDGGGDDGGDDGDGDGRGSRGGGGSGGDSDRGDSDRGGSSDSDRSRRDDGDDRDGRGRSADARAAGAFSALRGALGVRGHSEAGDSGERARRQIVALDLTAADRRALAARGFLTASTTRLAALGATIDRIYSPPELSEEAALERARSLAPNATFDYTHFYRGGGAACASEACWGAALIRVSAAAPDACRRGAPIAIIDTAVDVSHPALRGARIERRSFIDADTAAAPPDHGTAVAALLVGRLDGALPPLAPGARLLAAEAVGMVGDRERADVVAVIRGLDWALAGGARVVNISLAGAPNALLERAVTVAARSANLVAAAGNDGPRARPAYPAAYAAVTAVAALDARKRPWSGGNRGEYVEISAPGVDVPSAAPGGGVTTWTGTSFAAPFAAAALLRARAESGGSADGARLLLVRGAEDLGAPGRDPLTGYGLALAPGERCY